MSAVGWQRRSEAMAHSLQDRYHDVKLAHLFAQGVEKVERARVEGASDAELCARRGELEQVLAWADAMERETPPFVHDDAVKQALELIRARLTARRPRRRG